MQSKSADDIWIWYTTARTFSLELPPSALTKLTTLLGEEIIISQKSNSVVAEKKEIKLVTRVLSDMSEDGRSPSSETVDALLANTRGPVDVMRIFYAAGMYGEVEKLAARLAAEKKADGSA